MSQETKLEAAGQRYIKGGSLTFAEADKLWRDLKSAGCLSLARQVLHRRRSGQGLIGPTNNNAATLDKLCQQEALLTSKDNDLAAAQRDDRAIQILEERFGEVLEDLDGTQPTNQETLGIAGGILKRRWGHLGRQADLQRAAKLYGKGAEGGLGDDAYPHINAAFLEDLLAATGDAAEARKARAQELRKRIVQDLEPSGSWFNAASRAEALFGLCRYVEATEVIKSCPNRPEPWELETTARQLATLAHIQHDEPYANEHVKMFFAALLPGAENAVHSVFVGKVGLALSGGGFRASFYHLGVLARMAELDMLRHIDVLSCVSGGSIIGPCYWLKLRTRLLCKNPLGRQDYVQLIQELIEHFETVVAGDLRAASQKGILKTIWNFVIRHKKGAMSPEDVADSLEENFFGPLFGKTYLDELPFKPNDHDGGPVGAQDFNPRLHNWLRAHKVPALVLNATTINTGHSWQFTTTWMGESPWAIHEAADSVQRLEWHEYEPRARWRMKLSRAVAASAAVPGVFEPMDIGQAYGPKVQVSLVDGGLHDNQGTVALLAQDCNVVLVSDAAGQLLFEDKPAEGIKGLAAHAVRAMNILMERVRQANFADLEARRLSGQLRGFLFLHMKAGLDVMPVSQEFSQEPVEFMNYKLSRYGVRKDWQKALAELRTDLNKFNELEARALMACGYAMASTSIKEQLYDLPELQAKEIKAKWVFDGVLEDLTSTDPPSDSRKKMLEVLKEGSKVKIKQ